MVGPKMPDIDLLGCLYSYVLKHSNWMVMRLPCSTDTQESFYDRPTVADDGVLSTRSCTVSSSFFGVPLGWWSIAAVCVPGWCLWGLCQASSWAFLTRHTIAL